MSRAMLGMWVSAPVLHHQHHALGPERDEQVVDLEPGEHLGQRVAVLQVHRRAQGRLELAAVGLEHGGAGVLEELAVLGVHDDGDSAAPRDFHHRRDELRAASAPLL